MPTEPKHPKPDPITEDTAPAEVASALPEDDDIAIELPIEAGDADAQPG